MDRRTLLKTAAAAAVAAPVAAMEMPGVARAADTYDVAVCEQFSNRILVHSVEVDWTPENQIWAWTPPATAEDTWRNLTDIKFREIGPYGWVALVTASGGKVGVVNMPDEDPVRSLVWSARPYGNPHAIERIPGNGAVVTASSDGSNRPDVNYPGFLTLYAPTDPDAPSTLTKVQEIRFQGAHGVWWDGTHLWALGTWTLARYDVTGDGLATRLVADVVHTFDVAFNGHNIDTDLSDPAYLLITGGGSVKRVHKETVAIENWVPTGVGVKSYARVASGNSFWQQAIAVTDPADYQNEEYWNEYLQFFDSAGNPTFTKRLVNYGYQAKFYKARVSSIAFA